jgi:hypothetical protein
MPVKEMPETVTVFRDGRKIADWACDCGNKENDIVVNGNVEGLFEYKGEYYTLVFSWGETVVYPWTLCKCVKPENLIEESFITKEIIKDLKAQGEKKNEKESRGIDR